MKKTLIIGAGPACLTAAYELLENTVWLGLKYFVTEGDKMWTMSEKDFSDFSIDEMLKLGLIESKKNVLDSHVEYVKKAYPAYFDTYDEMDALQ